jgi:hypothetical protein
MVKGDFWAFHLYVYSPVVELCASGALFPGPFTDEPAAGAGVVAPCSMLASLRR